MCSFGLILRLKRQGHVEFSHLNEFTIDDEAKPRGDKPRGSHFKNGSDVSLRGEVFSRPRPAPYSPSPSSSSLSAFLLRFLRAAPRMSPSEAPESDEPYCA